MAKRDNFTTGEVATLLRLSQQTVIRAFDTGQLKGFKIPGSKHRRITREQLISFIREKELPFGDAERLFERLLLISPDKKLWSAFESGFRGELRMLICAESTFEAGLSGRLDNPDCVLLDLREEGGNVESYLQAVFRAKEFSESSFIVLLAKGVEAPQLCRTYEHFNAPLRNGDIQRRINRIISERCEIDRY